MEILTEDLPVSRLVLYKHGVGYVERKGRVQGGTVELEFLRQDMDDVLKSLLVFDHEGGRVTGVSYDGAEDVQEKLEKKALVPPEKEALLGLLRKLPGFRVRVKTTASEIEGEVVGTDESEFIGSGDVALPNPKLLVREASGSLVPVPLRELVNVELADPSASEDLQYFLRLVTSERKKDRRHLTVYLEGEQHDLSVAYLTSAPSWRVTYRLDHQKEGTALQAWGVVDNWLEEDLKGVHVSLVAGKPISFVYDVYVPRTVSRPVVREEVRALDAPVELEGAALKESSDQEERASVGGGPAPPPAVMSAAPRGAAMMARAKTSRNSQDLQAPLAESARVETRQVEGGDFFRYDVKAPLTVLRGQSALVPILQGVVPAERILVYNDAKVPGNPVAVLRWKNEQGVLERGPVVVLEEGTYAGEAILSYTPNEAECRVAFAVDLGVHVKLEEVSSRSTMGLVIDRTYARREEKRRRTTTYTVDNRRPDGAPLLIEHPREPGWQLIDTPKPEEESPDLRRFRLLLRPKSRSTLVVTEERVDSVAQATASLALPLMESILGEGSLTGPALQHLRSLIEVHREKARLERAIGTLQQSRNTLTQEQNRVRVNLSTVLASQNKALQTRYTEELQQLEERLVGLLQEEDRLQAGLASQEKRADQLIDTWPSSKAAAP